MSSRTLKAVGVVLLTSMYTTLSMGGLIWLPLTVLMGVAATWLLLDLTRRD